MLNNKYIKELTLIKINFSIESGRANVADTVRSNGQKSIKKFYQIKTEARRLLLKHGLPYMGGFVVPIDQENVIFNRLSLISAEFHHLKDCLINKQQHTISFEYRLIKIRPAESIPMSVNDWNNDMQRLGENLIEEIVQRANKFYAEKLRDGEQCAATTKKTLHNIRNKVSGLSFLNRALGPLTKLLDWVLRGYEQRQNIRNRNIVAPFFYQVKAAVFIMCERSRIDVYVNCGLIQTLTCFQLLMK